MRRSREAEMQYRYCISASRLRLISAHSLSPDWHFQRSQKSRPAVLVSGPCSRLMMTCSGACECGHRLSSLPIFDVGLSHEVASSEYSRCGHCVKAGWVSQGLQTSHCLSLASSVGCAACVAVRYRDMFPVEAGLELVRPHHQTR